MRILYSHRIQSRDGQSVHVEELVSAFRGLGHEVQVVGPGFYDQAAFGDESSAVARLRKLLPGAAGEVAELAYNIPAYRRLAAACARFKPDLIYERCNLYYLAGTWLARRTGLPLFLEVNSPLAQERSRHANLRLQRLAHRLERMTWRSATRVLPVTGVLADMLVQQGVRRDRITVVPNGIVLDRFPDRPAPGGTPLVLGFVGFVRDWHGMDGLIRSMAADPAPLALTLVGDGPERPNLERLSAELSVPVRFTGVVPAEQVPTEVAGFDIALLPKVVPYASPLKAFDYMAAARPIVAPDQPNIRETLRHEETALLFDPAEEGAMWRQVRRLIDDPALRARLGQAARDELVRRDYTWTGNARRIAGMAGA